MPLPTAERAIRCILRRSHGSCAPTPRAPRASSDRSPPSSADGPPGGRATAARATGGPRTSSRRRPSRSSSPGERISVCGTRCVVVMGIGVLVDVQSAAGPLGRRRRGRSNVRRSAIFSLNTSCRSLGRMLHDLGEGHRAPLVERDAALDGAVARAGSARRGSGPSMRTAWIRPAARTAGACRRSRPAARSLAPSCRARGSCSWLLPLLGCRTAAGECRARIR